MTAANHKFCDHLDLFLFLFFLGGGGGGEGVGGVQVGQLDISCESETSNNILDCI